MRQGTKSNRKYLHFIKMNSVLIIHNIRDKMNEHEHPQKHENMNISHVLFFSTENKVYISCGLDIPLNKET